MPKKKLHELGELQRAVLEALWARREATVRELLDDLERDVAYTTVLSVLQKLEKTGWVRHRREGRTYVYAPARSRESEGRSALGKLVERVFGGDSLVAFQHLLDDAELDERELAALRAMIDEKRSGGRP